ncbi:ABC transporter ATP-binding protein [Bacteriovorax sp. PP10]|uniref:ABC transporter ATP-binding protein n=1 Tax=Bacteriovorax antarcticus TaxID=3088717 RepID=A0ABU5VXR3_9BACT|nr:ABC transporter ATP-binding protein [Bacteriovorax sp. PP10]MEA9357143.1 ABC transporter ATP-binding protein [Bacteriovorax sp. PP10]
MALDNISFSVKKGSIHGFLGPNGAGKSTTMKILSGLIPETSGRYKVNGKVGFLPEHPPVYPNMSVYDYLKFVFSIYAGAVNEARIDEVMSKTGLTDVSSRLIGNLSKGYQQRVGIAQAIIHSPEIIILDEPTVGLDPVAIADIRSLILELKKEHTVLFSSHQLHDVELLCSDITLINRGEIVVSGAIDTILASLKTNMILKARVQNFSEEQKKKLISTFGVDSIEVTQDLEQKNTLLKIATKGKADIRAELARHLVDPSIGLLEFMEERGDLEDLFKRMHE